MSVVIPCRDAAPWLAQAIGSSLDQSVPPLEVIVVDDGSSDESLAVARSCADRHGERVRVIAETPGGASRARNIGARAARGDALMFLDADDVLAPDALGALADALAAEPGGVAICPWFRLDDIGGEWVQGPPSCAPRRRGEPPLAAWLRGWYHPPCSVLWSLDGLERAGHWDEQHAGNDDGNLMMRALARGVPLAETSRGAGFYRRFAGGGSSLSSRRWSQEGLSSRLAGLSMIEAILDDRSVARRYRPALREAYAKIEQKAPADSDAQREAQVAVERLAPSSVEAAREAVSDAIDRLQRRASRLIGRLARPLHPPRPTGPPVVVRHGLHGHEPPSRAPTTPAADSHGVSGGQLRAQNRPKGLERVGWWAAGHGLPPSWSRYRWVVSETLDERRRRAPETIDVDVIEPEAIARNELPAGVDDPDELPDDRGWWGYSFRDVPWRRSGATTLATVRGARVCWYRDDTGDFHPAAIGGDGRALRLRELRWRPRHGEVLRSSHDAAHLERATWVTERVYHNHSHWITAHLPKLVLLAERGALGDVVLPAERTAAIDASLGLIGLDPATFATFDHARPLEVDELTVLDTDRFRPELLQMVQRRCRPARPVVATRRVYISRARATRRRLLDEDRLIERLAEDGFEAVVMEDLSFDDQVALMRQTEVLLAPHGAGLTNMMFCPPGTHVVELADLSFPNPNFYALAAALGHRYRVVPAEPIGDRHPLERDLRIEDADIERALVGLRHDLDWAPAPSWETHGSA